MRKRTVCNDRAPLNRREWSVSVCFDRGRRQGFVAGLKIAQKNQARMRPVLEEIRARQPVNLVQPPVDVQIPNSVNANKLKEVFGINNYNRVLAMLRQVGFRADNFRDLGIRDYKILAQFMIDNNIKPAQNNRLFRIVRENINKAMMKTLFLESLYL